MPAEMRKIEELTEEGEWVSLKAKALQLWEPRSDAIAQVGLLGDETGKLKFVSWKKSQLPELREGESYLFKGVVVDVWNGQSQVNLNSRTKITKLDEAIEAGGNGGIEGRVTRIVPKSGYIERCPECNRVLVNDHCPVHLDVEPVEDFRVKVALDSTRKVMVANGEVAERLTDIDLEMAKEMDDEDLGCLLDVKLVGNRYRFNGADFGENFTVDSFEKIEE